ncbi:MAG TPA: type II toxin-antitoxin system VapC family toxin [Candidatus Binataceae bacterium]|nr:type II toxin-antitoxin system VapC family toxin [Candidatus Binataceae bacterium]
MTSIDTNVLVRIITNDDAIQAERAVTFIEKQPAVLILRTVLIETEWVLRASYHLSRRTILIAIRAIAELDNVEIEHHTIVELALGWYEQGLDFADSVHLVSAGTTADFATFDVSLLRKAKRLGITNLVAV